MSDIKEIPYGISDFNQLRNENYYFVDKTMYLPLIEKMPCYLSLTRPGGFGGSLFLSMMRTYYDVLQKDNFDKYFGDLWIGSHPTDLRNSFQVLYFDFSQANQGGGSLEENFNSYCNLQLTDFFRYYARFYQGEGMEELLKNSNAAQKLYWLEATARRLKYPLYLIIDNYDNFTSIVLSEQSEQMLQNLTHASNLYRAYFQNI